MDALTFLTGHVPLFAGLSEQALTPLAMNATLKSVAAGQTALYAGMTVDGLYVVAGGKAAVHVKAPGKSVALVAELGLGEVFGETSILEAGVATATIKAGTDGLTLLIVPEVEFRNLVAADPAFGARVRAMSAARRAAGAKKPA